MSEAKQDAVAVLLSRASFNVNHEVLVRLTERGKAIYRAHYERLEPPPPDGQGYTKFQLWDLMHVFGEHMFNGCSVPFETEIVLLPDAYRVSQSQATATVPDEVQRLREQVTHLQMLLNTPSATDENQRWLIQQLRCALEPFAIKWRGAQGLVDKSGDEDLLISMPVRFYRQADAALNGTTPQPRISAEAIAFMKQWAKNSDPVLREGMNLLIEAVEQWAQQPAPAADAVYRGSYGCLTDDCQHWNDGTCKDGVPCIAGHRRKAADAEVSEAEMLEDACRRIWEDCLDRRGIKYEFREIADDVRDNEIFPAWVECIRAAMRAESEASR